MYTHQNPNPFQSIASPCFAFGFLIPNVCNAHRRVSNRNRATDDTHRKSAQTNDHHHHIPIHPFPSPPSRVGPFGRQRSIAKNEQLTPALSRARRNPGRGNVGPTSRKTPSRQTSAPPAPPKNTWHRRAFFHLLFPRSGSRALPFLPAFPACPSQPVAGAIDRGPATHVHTRRALQRLARSPNSCPISGRPPASERGGSLERWAEAPSTSSAASSLWGVRPLRSIGRSEGRSHPIALALLGYAPIRSDTDDEGAAEN